MRDTSFEFEITEHIGTLSSRTDNRGDVWSKELNMVSWNGKDPVYDLRSWNGSHTKMGKGFSFTLRDMYTLEEILKNHIIDIDPNNR